jgi:hypothetical protein
MRNRRNQLWVAVALVVIVGGIVTAVLLRRRAAPDAVRLLPESDAVVYVNLEPIRLLTGLGKNPPKEREPQYEEFVRQTGFEFERDLDRAAFAIHYGATTIKDKPPEPRYSEILQGHFDSARVSDYLRKISATVERYGDYDIYVVPVENRSVRVALLGVETAAVSNVDDPQVIRGMIDRYKQAALPFAGPSLVSEYYRRVPLGSVVWTIARPPANAASEDHGEMLVPGGWSSLLPRDSIVIASARPLQDVHLRADVITSSDAAAQKFAEQVDAYLTLFKSLEISMDAGGPDKDVKAAFDSLQVHQDKSEAVLTATVPYGFFKKVLSASPAELGAEAPNPPKPEAPPNKLKPHSRR